MAIGYFINQYPKVSHSFVRREILALEAQGATVHRWALRGWDADLVDPIDLAERDRTRFLLRGGIMPLLVAGIAMLVRHPGRWFAALRLTAAMCRKTDRSIPLHLVSFLEGAKLAQEMMAAGVRHLHAHFGTNAAEIAMLGAAMAGIGYSFTVHGPDEFDRPLSTKLGLKIAQATHVVAITDFCASQLYRWAALEDWAKVKVVRCGLLPDFLDAPLTPPAENAHFVCIGRLSGQKGQLLLIEALALARRQGVPATLTLVGDGEMRGDVEAAITRHGMRAHVTITGWADERQVRAELDQARAMVMASFAEGLPIVVMEALALGRPVLATNVAAMADLVRNGETGWLYTPGSAEAIAQAMRECAATDRGTLAAMGRTGRALVAERHDQMREAAKLSRLLSDPVLA
ncbi:glycosyltransferase family 4 protein [Sphingomonas fuzhouensis]|uniref:glycosyltransferase family 4 protein n=1 Tax=Sphingomonas fuzhouensis TaxID=3106033 RepID=UPI002B003E1D|nr:glycosyltransferase family 4 protein [Sphingomonas sp. SGZ-02]